MYLRDLLPQGGLQVPQGHRWRVSPGQPLEFVFEEQGKGPKEEVVEAGIESEDDGEGDFAHMSRFTTKEG